MFTSYRISFLINIAALLCFILFVFYISLGGIPGAMIGNGSGMLVLIPCILLYLINDFAGLGLIKRLKNNIFISPTIMNRLNISLFIQFVMQLFLGYSVINLVYVIFIKYRRLFVADTDWFGNIFCLLLTVIFLTSSYNIFSSIRLITLSRTIQKENDQMIEELGNKPERP